MIQKSLNRKKINPSVAVYTGIKHEDKISLQLFQYNKDECIENLEFSHKKFKGFEQNDYKYWLNIHGLHDTNIITDVCSKIGVHDLVIQDILDINQRPKFQEYENYWFFTLKSILPSSDSTIEQEQLSFILSRNFLVSFQERKADYFNHIRERLSKNLGIVRTKDTDYLLFLLLESILDNYFKTVNDIEENIEDLGLIEINKDPSPETLKTIEQYKRQIHQIKKTIIPIKEFVSKVEREEFSFIEKKNIKYFYELRDLCFTLIDSCEHLEVRLESNTNLFFSAQSHRMNQVMKTLTVVSTIFIPLTFIAGIYGMNFINMPELQWKWGYYAILLLMIAIFVVMMIYFKRKKWF